MYILGVIILFTVIFYAFNPGGSPPTFDEIFEFGYNVTIRPFEVLASIRDGFSVFFDNLLEWFKSLF